MPISFINTNNQGTVAFRNISGTGSIIASYPAAQPASGAPWQQLNTIASYLRGYVTEFRNPLFYTYMLDGNAYQIADGGNDMFDGGNCTIPWLRAGTAYWNPGATVYSSAPALPYTSQSATLTDTNCYYVSFGYTQSAGTGPTIGRQNDRYHPMTMLSARSGSGPIGWQKSGNIGADGGGSIQTGSIYTGSTVNGFTVYAYYRQTYGESYDPNICDVYMLLGHSNWGSNFGNVNWSASLSTQGQGATLYATGSASNLLALTVLLSRTGSTPSGAGLPISASDIRNVVNNYTLRIKEALSF